jgi:hypothetical protein
MQPPNQPPPYQPPPPYQHFPQQTYQQQPFQPAPGPPVPQSPPTPPPIPRDVSVMEGVRFATSGSSGWNNILFNALCYFSTGIVPLIGLFVMYGYFAEVHRRLVLRHPEPYVRFDFSDLGPYLSRGVAPFVMYLLIGLPFALTGVLMAVLIVLGVTAGGAVALGGDEDLAVLAGFGIASLAFIPFAAFWITLSNAAVTRAELTGDLSKSLKLGAIWSYAGKTWKRALVTTILMSFVMLGLFLLGLLACFVGIYVTLTIGMIASLHIRWQIYNEYLLEGGEPIELAPWETLPSEAQRPPQYAAPPVRY